MKVTKFYNLKAEKHLIIQILVEKDFFLQIYTKIDTQVFYFQSHQILYRSINILHTKKVLINLPNLLSLLHSELVSETVINYLITLFNDRDNFRILNINDSLKVLLDNFIRRELQNSCAKIVSLTFNFNLSVETLLQKSNLLISNINTYNKKVSLKSISQLLLETILEIDKKTNRSTHVLTGFFDLDHILVGLQKSDLIIIAGRPSMGKTAFMLSLVRNVADIQSFPIVIFSLEMSSKQLIYRLISNETNIATSRLREGNISISEWEILNRAMTILSNLNIYLDDENNLDVLDIQSKLASLQQIYGDIGLIVIDYLQLLQYKEKSSQRHIELSYITRYLKLIAKDFNLPLVVLSQLSRNVEFRLNKRPILSDLKESGCLSYATNQPYFLKSDNVNFSKLTSLKVSNHYILSATLELLIPFQYNRIYPIVSLIKRELQTGYKVVYELDFYISVIVSTVEHYVLTLNGWKRILELTVDDLVATLDIQYLIYNNTEVDLFSSNVIFSSVINLICMNRINVYDFWIPKTNNFFVNALLVHNSIEQDADVVLFLYRDSYYQHNLKQSNIDMCEVIVAKHRHGTIGMVNLIFNPNTVSFMNLIKES
ncbi:replication helicase subunit (chloroplast) [Guillardia theta]|uniref:Probable replicative DNA helicase n=2 Tax=Guillardia theta TaxID=55529 RepID=DNAB_GUITH|nr:replication helicase subunit [Guillardia theta]O78411.1 RecName: Full=Probable replicative DNA helicase; Contains: RecName: Full=Gth dnaB intein [Guillardia theta]AAC35596.1 replication helicase subunit [Guillardia theta]